MKRYKGGQQKLPSLLFLIIHANWYVVLGNNFPWDITGRDVLTENTRVSG